MSNTNQQARRLPILHINADERHALETFKPDKGDHNHE